MSTTVTFLHTPENPLINKHFWIGMELAILDNKVLRTIVEIYVTQKKWVKITRMEDG